jgi:hypothetical protein
MNVIGMALDLHEWYTEIDIKNVYEELDCNLPSLNVLHCGGGEFCFQGNKLKPF